MSVTREWLDLLYSRSPGYFTVCAFDHGKISATRWYSTSDIARAARTIDHASEKLDVYVSVATHAEPQAGGSRGNARSARSIAGFWADLDIGIEGHKDTPLPNPSSESQALSILDGLPEPTAVIHSGGGLQAWWLFDAPWEFADGAEAASAAAGWQRLLIERAESQGLHVDAVGDLARILRVPGTINHKIVDQPRPVALRTAAGPRHALAELASLALRPAESHAEPRSQAPEGDPLGSWASILEPHGWTLAGDRPTDGAQLWRRPGKTEGHSAVAMPYGIDVLVNFSGSSGLPVGPGQKLTKFKVWSELNFEGDQRAAKAALQRLTQASPSRLASASGGFDAKVWSWEIAYKADSTQIDWLCEPLVERGRQIAFFSEAKAGKSLLWLEIAGSLAAGRTVLGNAPHEPLTVVYIDQENTQFDVVERLRKMGFEPSDLDRLLYYGFPGLSPLDTEAGGFELYAIAKVKAADLVIIDTLSRVVAGEENSNDTYHDFYRHTGIRLKADGISLVRLDHSGKDRAKGMRGASSKTTDVDEVWQLVDDSGRVSLTRTHSRSNHGDNSLVLARLDDPLRHERVSGAESFTTLAAPSDVAVWLDLQGVPPVVGVNTVWAQLGKKENERGYSFRQISEAQQARRKLARGK